MRRLIRVAAVATLLSPLLVAAPAVLAAPPAGEAVAPSVQEIALPPVPAAGPTKASATVATAEMDTEPFSVLGVTWADGDLADVGVQVRTRTDGRWSDWSVLDAEIDEGPSEGSLEDQRQRGGTAPYWVGEADGVQVRVAAGPVAPRDLELALIDPGTSDADTGVVSEKGSTAAAAVGRPAIKSRAQWGADESIRRGSASYSSTIRAGTLHHTASSNSYSESQVPALIRGFYAYHVQSRGWSDIGYNFLVDKFGNMWEGRAGGMDKPVTGAHAGGFNTDTVGVSMIGTYEDVAPSAATLNSVAQIFAWKLSLYGRDPQGSLTMRSGGSTRYSAGTNVTLPTIFGHRQVSATSCPGDKGYAAMPGVRSNVASIMAGGGSGTAAPTNGEPVGSVDQLTPNDDGTATLRGWALDPDSDDALQVVVQSDGQEVDRFTADGSRPDVGAAYGRGDRHGFDRRIRVPEGQHKVCVWAKDSETGAGVSLNGRDCSTITMAKASDAPAEGPGDEAPEAPTENVPPIGSLDEVEGLKDDVAGPIRLTGWAMDPNTDDPVVVLISVNGKEEARFVAEVTRTDLADLGRGDRHGWRATLELPPGDHEVCATVLDASTGDPADIGCRTLSLVENVAPIGFVDAAGPWRNDSIRVLGWAEDRNAKGPVQVSVRVDGKPVKKLLADAPRPDLVRAGQTPEDRRGFEVELPSERGRHEVCVLAADTSTDEEKTLRCTEVVVGSFRRLRAG